MNIIKLKGGGASAPKAPPTGSDHAFCSMGETSFHITAMEVEVVAIAVTLAGGLAGARKIKFQQCNK